ncbi:MAG: glycoside hydrolase family 31 protein [Anaerolineae bacterium]|nr:glycoside hydrolase family 31 protein [Thermoflexales bacterium]MDW8407441.1 glycoside hydrolase family 31 protein [Anaerolineae bacterium]
MTLFEIDGNALLIRHAGEVIRIEPWGEHALRVRATVNAAFDPNAISALLPVAAPASGQITIQGQRAVVGNGSIAAEITARDSFEWADPTGMDIHIRFVNSVSGQELLAESSYHPSWPPPRHYRPVGGDLWQLETCFRAYDAERLYGLGQHQHGRLDQKGCVIELLQQNGEVSIPFMLSSRGYGFLWNNPAVGRVELGTNGTRWTAEATSQLDYWITAGNTPSDIIRHYTAVTGRAPLLPEFAAGFWQCKLRYQTQDELLRIARAYKQRGLPLSVIVIDFFHWTRFGDWRFDPHDWPDPSGMVKELAQMGVRVMVSVWPALSPNSANFKEAMQQGWLIRNLRGQPAQMAFVDRHVNGRVYLAYYDATHPEARRFIWQQVKQGYYDHGIKVYWLDACEPEMYPVQIDNLRFYSGDGRAVANAYPMLHARAFYEGMRGEGEEDVIFLCRSAWAGSQRYGAAVWSGDIQSTWEALQVQVRAGLNIGLSGIPWWTTDIGGFFGGDIQSDYFRELIVRWFQYGALCPLFRLHGYRLPYGDISGSGGDNEVWAFGEPAYSIIREVMFLRERLRPYVMRLMHTAHQQGDPPMRPLFYDFPADSSAWSVEDQFMFGPDVLVAPVLQAGARSRAVYLPAGAHWTDAWNRRTFPGGVTVQADASLERLPLFLRDGADLAVRQ